MNEWEENESQKRRVYYKHHIHTNGHNSSCRRDGRLRVVVPFSSSQVSSPRRAGCRRKAAEEEDDDEEEEGQHDKRLW